MKSKLASQVALAALAIGSVHAAAGQAQARELRAEIPDRLELGRDAPGNPCTATRFWNDPASTGYFSVSYSITCRGATASRSLGIVRSYKIEDAAKAEASLQCGAAAERTVPGLGAVRARRCVDGVIGLETVVTSFEKNGRRFLVSAASPQQGVAEEALRVVSGSQAPNEDRNRKSEAAIEFAALEAPAGGTADAALAYDPQTALQQGLRLLRQGLHMEASRVLNDGLSRMGPDTPLATRIDLLLVAGLADSNLRFFDSAAEYFARADQLLAENPTAEGAAVLARKRENYAALDLLNRRRFAGAVSALDQLVSAPVDPQQPLTDPATVRSLNQSGEGGGGSGGSVAVPDVSTLSQLVIDSQANWARSVALLAQSKPADAMTALNAADRSFSVLRREKVDQRQVLWLDARIEKQRARILARQGDVPGALAALDRAIASLNRAGADGSGIGPTLAETQLERAAIAARATRDRQAILAQFDGAVDSLVASGALGSVLPPSIEKYLDLLVEDAAADPGGNAGERFFRAIQAVGEPAVARQFTQLQSVVTADPSLAAKVQDRSEIEREITQLRFQLASTPAEQAGEIEALDKRRAAAEARLIAIDAELQTSNAFSAVDDRPATIAEVQTNLRPGEAYLKVTEIRNYAFGILIDQQGYQIYRVARPIVEVRPVAELVRASIDGGANNKLPVFNVAGSYALFQLLLGPVEERLLAAETVIVDPSGPLEKLPVGVLVTDRASVDSFASTRAANPYDYSRVNFLAKRLSVSSALSPRSFIVARRLPASTAPQPFMGFAQHMPVPMSGQLGGRMLSVGSGCQVELSAIAALTNQLAPIDSRELDRATAALGVPGAPELTGQAFTDTAVKARTDLDQFQILHFATHGLTEGQWGCAKSPPALVTSLDGDGSDAILSFSEIAGLKLNANLVVLSACDTASGVSAAEARASGQEESGATLEGLVRAFLTANTRAVLTTYWPISDEGESEALIENFYRAGRSSDIATALRGAQTGLMSDPKTSHPIYWGAFFVVGDASKTMLSGAAQTAIAPAPQVARAGVAQ